MIRVGDQIPLQLQLFDGATGKFPQAVVKDATGTAISGSPFDLAHVANGHYSNLTAVMPSTAFVTIQYLVYSDAGHTTLDTGYSIDLEVQEQDNSLITSGYTAPDNATIAAIAGYVDTEVAAIKAKTDNLPADPADNSDILAAIAGIPTGSAPTVGQIADAVWDEPIASHLGSGSTGEKLNNGSTGGGGASTPDLSGDIENSSSELSGEVE